MQIQNVHYCFYVFVDILQMNYPPCEAGFPVKSGHFTKKRF